ncbi:antagonist of KipI [Evansella caseinilytica]|uniref:Antagonist of KipI n=1 Tax=Evansella caseinilytica TaxID=1503961 RepID=A0A1H3V2I7_9BACI|nr:biotin-dependent carboxyltransferase family protein [Evansella caseinilytica]SDZ68245.1 antagonist of KipI [Evansella caseinilytica]
MMERNVVEKKTDKQTVGVLEVIEPGLHTTVQDLGRHGYQKYGIGPSGVMDDYAFQLANILVGNEREEAGLEITMIGPSLRVLQDTVIAITGASLSPSLDRQPLPMWTSVYVKKGQEIRFGKPQSGVRAYLAVAGGIQVPEVMGSKSTNVKSRFGGLDGRALAAKDILPSMPMAKESVRLRKGKRLPRKMVPVCGQEASVRVLAGPQEGLFTAESVSAFYSTGFQISPQSDRMGYRLTGEKKLELRDNTEMITDAVATGAIQVPGNGEPILLMADRQTSGGYPKIANVISADLWKVAQRLPGQTIRFEKVTLAEAHEELREREQCLRQLQLAVRLLSRAPSLFPYEKFN